MAKTPKAPGKNGASTPAALIDAFALLVPSNTDPHWRSEVVNAAIVPIAKLAGETRARQLLVWFKDMPYWNVRALFSLAHGLALAGDKVGAKKAIDEAESRFTDAGIEGQFGTLAWIDAAYAFYALGQQGECDRALDAALSYAKREQNHPTQPRPWLAVALARTGRANKVLADLRERLPNQRLSFDDDRSLKLVTEWAVSRGDAALFAKIDAEQTATNGYTVAEGLADGALGAAKGGHGDALVEMCAVFAKDRPYGPRTMSRIAWALAAEGHIALGAKIVERTRAACSADIAGHDHFSAFISRPIEDGSALSDGVSFLTPFRVAHRIDAGAALSEAERRAAKLVEASAGNDRSSIENLGLLGVALCAVGETERGGALVTKAIEAAQSLDNMWKSYALKTIALAACGFDLGEHAFAAFKKITSKPNKVEVVRALSLVYVRQGDFTGASMTIMMGEPRASSLMMRHTDALCVAAAVPTVFSNYV